MTTLLVIAALGIALAFIAGRSARATDPPPTTTSTMPIDWQAKYEAEHKLSAKRLLGWRAMERDRNRYKRTLLAQPKVSEAINLACAIYGYCSTLWRKARCESRLNPWARNGSEASGLFQFLPSTWRSTPFGGFSVFSPYANALGAGWMHAHGRGGEWVCR